MNTTFIGEYAEFPNLTYCNSGLFISAPNLRNNPCPNLEYWESGTYASANGVFWGDCNIQTLIFPNLEKICPDNNNAAFLKNGNIEELYLRGLKMIYSNYYGTSYCGGMLIGSFPNLKKIVLGNITTQASIFGVTSANVPNLIHLEFLSLDVGCDLSKWTLSQEGYSEEYTNLIENIDICDSNYEQFLYNFKSYIVDRLIRESSKRYLKLRSVLYTVVSSATLTKFTDGQPYKDWLNQKLSDVNFGLSY